jgi:hypothetical protein
MCRLLCRSQAQQERELSALASLFGRGHFDYKDVADMAQSQKDRETQVIEVINATITALRSVLGSIKSLSQITRRTPEELQHLVSVENEITHAVATMRSLKSLVRPPADQPASLATTECLVHPWTATEGMSPTTDETQDAKSDDELMQVLQLKRPESAPEKRHIQIARKIYNESIKECDDIEDETDHISQPVQSGHISDRTHERISKPSSPSRRESAAKLACVDSDAARGQTDTSIVSLHCDSEM